MHFEVDSERVRVAATQIARTEENIRQEVSAMVGLLTDLDGSWRGAAAASFRDLLTEWRQTQARVEQSLAGINRALAGAADAYAQAESSVRTMFGSGR